MPTNPISSPLQYHMNDLFYYLGLSTGGTLGKRLSILEDIAAMATGMVHDKEKNVIADVENFYNMVTLLRGNYIPMFDTNPYLIPQYRRFKLGLTVVTAEAYFLADHYKLITGNIMRARLLNAFGRDRMIVNRDDSGDANEFL